MALIHNNISDFVLFPRDHAYQDMADPSLDNSFTPFPFNMGSDFQHFSDLASSTYDTYESVSVYSSAQTSYLGTPHLVVDAPKDNSRHVPRRYTPSASPSTSMSQSLDNPPSTLSSASGASVQSTASSAVGSPYSHATRSLPGHDQWTDSHVGLAIAHGVPHNDVYAHDTFPLPGMENDVAFHDSKFSGSFVGELRKISSSSTCSDHMSSPQISSRSASQSFIPPFSTPPLALDTSVGTRNVTIDSILEEVNSNIDTPTQLLAPDSVSPANASPAAATRMQPASSPEQNSSAFKSPTTPASAMSPPLISGVASPSQTRWYEPRRLSATFSDTVKAHSGSPLASRRPRSTFTPVSPEQCHWGHFQTPFFNQSSGRFVAPLQSSCWFSLAAIFLAFHY